MGRQHKARAWWAAIPPSKRRQIKERQQREAEARLRDQLRANKAGYPGQNGDR